MPKAKVTSYSSRPVDVEPSFLSGKPNGAPITVSRVDFTKTPLAQRGAAYAVVLDGVLTPEECATLVSYAEQSSPSFDEANGKRGWAPALVNVGAGREVLATEYRNSERIIWDSQDMMDRLWARVVQAPGIEKDLAWLDGRKGGRKIESVLGNAAKKSKWREPETWKFARLNERMRFLRYEPGMFFKEHCDGHYTHPSTGEKSFLTLHLYLNDSVEGVQPEPFVCSTKGEESDGGWLDAINPFKPSKEKTKSLSDVEGVDLRGGATTFYTDDMRASIDVFPKNGRVLIFQQRALLHAGGDVHAGVKFTMRTDLMYEFSDKDE